MGVPPVGVGPLASGCLSVGVFGLMEETLSGLDRLVGGVLSRAVLAGNLEAEVLSLGGLV